MSTAILSTTMIILMIAAFAYQRFRPKVGANYLFYAALVLLLLEIGLHAIAVTFFREPLRSFFDIRFAEYNHSASLSSSLLFISAAIAFGLCFQKRSTAEILYFLALSLCFLFLAFDEYFMIHETLANWSMVYALVALVMAACGALVFRHSRADGGLLIYLALFGGMALAATGSIGVEEFFGRNCLGLLNNRDCSAVPLLEEVLETLGFIFAATGLSLLQSSKKLHRFTFTASALWLAFLLYSTWLHPALEAQFLAQTVNLRFENTPIVLDAYRLNAESFREAERLSIDLYWHTETSTSKNFGYTINLLDPLTGETLWRENLSIAYPATTGWFSGLIYRSHYDFPIPDTIETPVSPILTVALWSNEGDSYYTHRGISESLPVFAEQFPVIGRISLLSRITNFSPGYRFANGIVLAEPELSRESERQYHLLLSWSTEANNLESLAYFIHLLGIDGQENLIFDRQPFENRFPSNMWRMGMHEHDEIILSLPEEASGTYLLRLGLFDGTNRLAVTDVSGNPMPEQSIQIGTISVPR